VNDERAQYLRLALEEGVRGARAGHGGPFGAVIVQGDRVVAAACNEVTSRNDPTAHAEIQAIRAACQALGTFRLDDCDVYSSCEPCPMCLAALYWARPRAVYYGATRAHAADAGFDDAVIYDELDKAESERTLRIVRLAIDGVGRPFDVWRTLPGKVRY
jgi:guanine deaminase